MYYTLFLYSSELNEWIRFIKKSIFNSAVYQALRVENNIIDEEGIPK